MPQIARLERAFEQLLFGSRWLLAPFYLGLALSLVVLFGKFVLATADLLLNGWRGNGEHLIVAVLGLVDISLLANLVIMVMFAGYENFVSRLDAQKQPDRPSWLGHVGFAELKLKLMASIVAISAIQLLEDFVDARNIPDRDLAWRAGLHVLFVVSGLLLAFMDRLSQAPTERDDRGR